MHSNRINSTRVPTQADLQSAANTGTHNADPRDGDFFGLRPVTHGPEIQTPVDVLIDHLSTLNPRRAANAFVSGLVYTCVLTPASSAFSAIGAAVINAGRQANAVDDDDNFAYDDQEQKHYHDYNRINVGDTVRAVTLGVFVTSSIYSGTRPFIPQGAPRQVADVLACLAIFSVAGAAFGHNVTHSSNSPGEDYAATGAGFGFCAAVVILAPIICIFAAAASGQPVAPSSGECCVGYYGCLCGCCAQTTTTSQRAMGLDQPDRSHRNITAIPRESITGRTAQVPTAPQFPADLEEGKATAQRRGVAAPSAYAPVATATGMQVLQVEEAGPIAMAIAAPVVGAEQEVANSKLA